MKVLAFGEILWDVIEDQKHIGGAPLNFAAHYRQCGGESGIISRLGNDNLGEEALDAVKFLGVNTHFVQFDPDHPTGVVNVALKKGSPTYDIVENVAYDHIGTPNRSAVTDYDAFYFGTLAQRGETSQNSLLEILNNSSFDHIFYDVNLRKGFYSQEIIKLSLGYCTMFKLNDEEGPVIDELLHGSHQSIDSFIKKLLKRFSNLQLIILTEGPRGCRVFGRSGMVQAPSDKITVKDTVGAGDSFSAAFMYTYQKTNDPETAARVANRVGGFVASSSGAVPSYSPAVKALLPK